jgi:hypothetical protein
MSRNGIDTSAIVVENRRIQECFPKVEPEPLLETGSLSADLSPRQVMRLRRRPGGAYILSERTEQPVVSGHDRTAALESRSR